MRLKRRAELTKGIEEIGGVTKRPVVRHTVTKPKARSATKRQVNKFPIGCQTASCASPVLPKQPIDGAPFGGRRVPGWPGAVQPEQAIRLSQPQPRPAPLEHGEVSWRRAKFSRAISRTLLGRTIRRIREHSRANMRTRMRAWRVVKPIISGRTEFWRGTGWRQGGRTRRPGCGTPPPARSC
jgi:hypothetical protein